MTFLSCLPHVLRAFLFFLLFVWTRPKEGTTFQGGSVFVLMTLCCDLGQMRRTAVNSKKPFEMTTGLPHAEWTPWALPSALGGP